MRKFKSVEVRIHFFSRLTSESGFGENEVVFVKDNSWISGFEPTYICETCTLGKVYAIPLSRLDQKSDLKFSRTISISRWSYRDLLGCPNSYDLSYDHKCTQNCSFWVLCFIQLQSSLKDGVPAYDI